MEVRYFYYAKRLVLEEIVVFECYILSNGQNKNLNPNAMSQIKIHCCLIKIHCANNLDCHWQVC